MSKPGIQINKADQKKIIIMLKENTVPFNYMYISDCLKIFSFRFSAKQFHLILLD